MGKDATAFSFWQRREVAASCVKLEYDPAPCPVKLRLDPACGKCKTLGQKMLKLAQANQIAPTIKQVDGGCHQTTVFDETFSSWHKFRERFKAHEKTLLPAQKDFALDYSQQSEESERLNEKADGVAMVWEVGSGKTLGILNMLFGRHRIPSRFVIILCPKTLIPQWSDELASLRPLGPTTVWIMGPSYFSRIPRNETLEDGIRLADIKKAAVVMDECQEYCTDTAARIPDLLLLRKARERYLLSGTPFKVEADVECFFSLLEVPLKTMDGEFRSLQDVCDELIAKKQISYYNPAVNNPAWFRDNFPNVERVEKRIPLTFTQVATCLLATRQLIIAGVVYGDAVRDSYKTRTRIFCNSVELPDGAILSPKIDEAVRLIRENPDLKFAIHSNFIELGIGAVAKKLKEHKIPFAMIDGSQTMDKRDQGLQAYNSGAVKVILYSDAARTGINLMNTDHLFKIGVEFLEAKKAQTEGRVIRYHSHPKGATVRCTQFIATLPDLSTEPSELDCEGLVSLYRSVLPRSKDNFETALARMREAVAESLATFDVTQTTEEDLLDHQRRVALQLKPVYDTVALAGTRTHDAVRKRLRNDLEFETEADARALDDQDLETLANCCRKFKRPRIFHFVAGRPLQPL